jgi:hypothetical protein
MAKVAAENKVKVYFLPTAASVSAPTVANITAGTHLTPWMPVDGLDIGTTQNNAELTILDDGTTLQAVGTEVVGPVNMTFTRDSTAGDDDPWVLFVRGLTGFILVSRFGAPVAGSRVEVYSIESHDPVNTNPAGDTFQLMTVSCPVNGDSDRKAVVAA